MRPSDRGLSRRDFVKGAVAIGGATALAACTEREPIPDLPQGPDDLSTLPARQHAWNEYLDRDDHGNALPPRHHVVLLLDYAGEGAPTGADRDAVASSLRALDRAYQRSNEGLSFTAAYSPAYFDRYEASLPDSIGLSRPEPLAPFEDPELDDPDAVVHLASDYGQVVLAAEEALVGDRADLNGVTVPSLAEVLERRDRRTGFVGAGLPAENQDVAGVPDSAPVDEDAPLYMGFKSSFTGNQASEDAVTVQSGPFADGTTAHLSKISLQLEQWYEQDSRYQRVAKMFSPVHAEEGKVEDAGANLGTDTAMGDIPAHTDEHARSFGVVGHSQKTARAREDDDPLILRRDFDSTDGGHAGVHFLSLQRTVADFVATREAMNGTDVADSAAVGTRTNNGILQYMTVERRGNYLLPPRRHRALPAPDPRTGEG